MAQDDDSRLRLIELSKDKRINALDEEFAARWEKPKRDGFQALSKKQRFAVLEWLSQHCESRDHVNRFMTSEHLSIQCEIALKKSKMARRVDNLAIKTAMALLGFEPISRKTGHQHYRIHYRKEGI